MNEIPEEVQEFVKMLQSKGAEVRVVQGTKAALKEFVNELVEMKEQEEQEQEQDSIQDLPFEIALMALRLGKMVKRKDYSASLVMVNDHFYAQMSNGDLIRYNPTYEDLTAKDWGLVND